MRHSPEQRAELSQILNSPMSVTNTERLFALTGQEDAGLSLFLGALTTGVFAADGEIWSGLSVREWFILDHAGKCVLTVSLDEETVQYARDTIANLLAELIVEDLS